MKLAIELLQVFVVVLIGIFAFNLIACSPNVYKIWYEQDEYDQGVIVKDNHADTHSYGEADKGGKDKDSQPSRGDNNDIESVDHRGNNNSIGSVSHGIDEGKDDNQETTDGRGNNNSIGSVDHGNSR